MKRWMHPHFFITIDSVLPRSLNNWIINWYLLTINSERRGLEFGIRRKFSCWNEQKKGLVGIIVSVRLSVRLKSISCDQHIFRKLRFEYLLIWFIGYSWVKLNAQKFWCKSFVNPSDTKNCILFPVRYVLEFCSDRLVIDNTPLEGRTFAITFEMWIRKLYLKWVSRYH